MASAVTHAIYLYLSIYLYDIYIFTNRIEVASTVFSSRGTAGRPATLNKRTS
ncbi:hypothetical protein BJX61DRAFT_502209 [Aspergillus egyptiacus]|nr:hypothetical protein BJX61DRAFT_502209 [Aspergillus egyptiacus]